MKTLKTFRMGAVLVASALWAGAAAAQVKFDVPRDLPVAKSTLSRAEVVADFLVWRAAGLHALHNRGERTVDTTTDEYARAAARYNHMRATPQFALLVDQMRLGGPARILLASR